MLMNVVTGLNDQKDTLVLFVDDNLKVYQSELLATETLVHLEQLFGLSNFKGGLKQVSLYLNVKGLENFGRVLVVGLGKVNAYSVSHLKQVVAALTAQLSEVKPLALTLLCPPTLLAGTTVSSATEAAEQEAAYHTASVLVEALNYSRYQFKRFLTLDKKDNNQHAADCSCCTAIKNYNFVVPQELVEAFKQGINHARAVSAGVKLARDLGNLPANICTPAYLADTGRKLAQDYDKLEVEVLDEHAMAELGMGCYLAVAQGTVNRPYLTVLKYNGAADANQQPYVFVGKGMTFDLSLIHI